MTCCLGCFFRLITSEETSSETIIIDIFILASDGEKRQEKIGSSQIDIWLEPFRDLARAKSTYGSSHLIH
jgi:hypothetical protein